MSNQRRKFIAFDIFTVRYDEPFAIIQLASTSSTLLKTLRIPWWSWCNQPDHLPHLLLTQHQEQHISQNDVQHWRTTYQKWARVGRLFKTHRYYSDLELDFDQRMLQLLQNKYTIESCISST